jgi:hypothetical protein
MVRLHPYQSSYFNEFVGGVAGAEGRYETDYWISSYREAMLWINERAAQKEGRPLRVLIATNEFGAKAYAAPSVEFQRLMSDRAKGSLPRKYDYYLGTTRFSGHTNFPDTPIVHRVGRDGATFAVIKGHRSKSE